MAFEEVVSLTTKIFRIVLTFSAFLFLYRGIYAILGFGSKIRFKKATKNNKFAILIPARNESKVIRDLFEGLKSQIYDKSKYDVFVIVKDKNDKTIEIANEYNYNVIVEPNQTCKGDALDSTIKYIYQNKINYDAFLIFDADNVPLENFLFEINKAVDAGYDIGMGYRNSKNWNDGWVASCSGLTFSLINTLSNKGRTKLAINNVFSGTGYFIKESIIAKFKCWPFKTLTEDYEISMYATLNNLKTTYVEKAEYFDEQPIDIKTSIKQRERWVKGFVSVRKIYSHKIFKSIFIDKNNILSKIEQTIGILPLVVMIIDTILYFLMQIVFVFWSLSVGSKPLIYIINLLSVTLITYVILQIFTIVMLFAERKKIDMTIQSKILCTLTNPFFIALYLPIAIKAILSKNIGWTKIEHTRNIKTLQDEELVNSQKVFEENDEIKLKK